VDDPTAVVPPTRKRGMAPTTNGVGATEENWCIGWFRLRSRPRYNRRWTTTGGYWRCWGMGAGNGERAAGAEMV